MNRQELCEHFKVSETTIKTNFPTFARKQLAKGFLITRKGKGDATEYTVKEVEPEYVSKDFFSQAASYTYEELPNEQWKDCFGWEEDYEVSNLGRLRQKQSKKIFAGTKKNGYVFAHIHSNPYPMHRLVLQSFMPNENYQYLTVDHINGKRDDNRLENLRWATNQENISFMVFNRKEINAEITRLILKYGYEEALSKIKQIE